MHNEITSWVNDHRKLSVYLVFVCTFSLVSLIYNIYFDENIPVIFIMLQILFSVPILIVLVYGLLSAQ